MKRALKWLSLAIGALLVVVTVLAGAMYLRASSRLGNTYDVQAEDIEIPTDAAAVARGEHLAEAVTVCQGCHGEDLSGDVIDDEGLIATIAAPNLTTGEGGLGGTLTDADLVRAIRHGVLPDGRGLLIMHSDVFHNLSAEDLGALIAYIRSVPPVNTDGGGTTVRPVGKVMVGLGLFDMPQMPLIPAEVIDHDAPLAERPPLGRTEEYGAYLMSITLCRMCHGADLTGGDPIDDGAPPAPNIAAHAAPGGWTEAEFITTLRTGVTPTSHELNSEWMPWDIFGKMTDDELGAIWLYMQSLNDSA